MVRKATLNANPAQRREVSRLCDVVLADVNGGRPWRKSDHAFHGAIYEASGNPMFGQILLHLDHALERSAESPFGRDGFGLASFPPHRTLADAILAADVEAAVAAIQLIIDSVEGEISSVIAADPASLAAASFTAGIALFCQLRERARIFPFEALPLLRRQPRQAGRVRIVREIRHLDDAPDRVRLRPKHEILVALAVTLRHGQDRIDDSRLEPLGEEALRRPFGILDHVMQDRSYLGVVSNGGMHHAQDVENVGLAVLVGLAGMGLDGNPDSLFDAGHFDLHL